MMDVRKTINVMMLSVFVLVLTACTRQSKDHVVLATDLGEIQIQLYPERAPSSVENFLYYVDNGLYDGEGFYRAVHSQNDPRGQGMQIIQGGLLSLKSVTASIAHEDTRNSGLSHTDGAISIARDEPGTGSAAYFFISIGDNKSLDFGGNRNPDGQGYAVFGRVIKGMDVVRAIQMQSTLSSETENEPEARSDPPTAGQFLEKPVRIVAATRR